MLLVRLPVNSSLLIVKFGGSQKLYMDIQQPGGSAPLTATLFKGQMYPMCLKVEGETQTKLLWVKTTISEMKNITNDRLYTLQKNRLVNLKTKQ